MKVLPVIDSPRLSVIGEPESEPLATIAKEGEKFGGRGTDCAGAFRRNRAAVNGAFYGGSDELPGRREEFPAFSAIVPGIAKRSSVTTRALPAIGAKVIAFPLK